MSMCVQKTILALAAVVIMCANAPVSYGASSCATSNPCSLPWGGSILSGQSTTAYAASSVPYGSSCSGQTRTCSNGTLSGSYANQSCTVQPPANCTATTHTWSGCSGSVAAKSSGSSETVNNTASGYTGTITASCSNGTWSYTSASCTATGCPSQYVYWSACEATSSQLTEGQSQALNYSSGCEAGGGPDTSTTGSVTVTCTNGALVQSGATCRTLVACFTADVKITLADGTTKLMRDLRPGDRVRGNHGINTVLNVPAYDNVGSLYSFNGSKPFVTGGHPFWTQNGWKAVDPSLTPKEGHNVKTTKLQVGDTLYLAGGKTTVLQSLKSDGPPASHHVYDPIVSGDHTYYANGYLVHNKWAGCQ